VGWTAVEPPALVDLSTGFPSNERLYFFAFAVRLLVDFFTFFFAAFFAGLFKGRFFGAFFVFRDDDLFEAFLFDGFLAAAFAPAVAFFTAFAAACIGADFAAAFFTRLTTAVAAEWAIAVAVPTTRSPTMSPISGFGWLA
jgi:hypothetical protein